MYSIAGLICKESERREKEGQRQQGKRRERLGSAVTSGSCFGFRILYIGDASNRAEQHSVHRLLLEALEHLFEKDHARLGVAREDATLRLLGIVALDARRVHAVDVETRVVDPERRHGAVFGGSVASLAFGALVFADGRRKLLRIELDGNRHRELDHAVRCDRLDMVPNQTTLRRLGKVCRT